MIITLPQEKTCIVQESQDASEVTPLGPTAGAGLGVVTGVGAANSLGVEAGNRCVIWQTYQTLWKITMYNG